MNKLTQWKNMCLYKITSTCDKSLVHVQNKYMVNSMTIFGDTSVKTHASLQEGKQTQNFV